MRNGYRGGRGGALSGDNLRNSYEKYKKAYEKKESIYGKGALTKMADVATFKMYYEETKLAKIYAGKKPGNIIRTMVSDQIKISRNQASGITRTINEKKNRLKIELNEINKKLKNTSDSKQIIELNNRITKINNDFNILEHMNNKTIRSASPIANAFWAWVAANGGFKKALYVDGDE